MPRGELEALSALSHTAVTRFSESLDPRVSRRCLDATDAARPAERMDDDPDLDSTQPGNVLSSAIAYFRGPTLPEGFASGNGRYERGLSAYLDVLDQERQLFRAELDLASSTRDQLTAVVQVYKALGGGWER